MFHEHIHTYAYMELKLGRASLDDCRTPHDRFGAHHAKGIFEGKMCGERGETLPQGLDSLLLDDGVSAVSYSAILTRAVELQPSFDHVDGLKAACLHHSAHRPGDRLHGRCDYGYIFLLDATRCKSGHRVVVFG